MTFIPPAPANHRNSAVLVASTSLVVNVGNDAWGPTSVIGRITLGSTFLTELKVGTSALPNRHTLKVLNDSSFLFYVKNTTTLPTSDGVLVNSGVAAEITLNPSQSVKFYGITFAGTADIKIIEISN
jgi:hypothetical protein